MNHRHLMLINGVVILSLTSMACSGGNSPVMPWSENDPPPISQAGQYDFSKNSHILWAAGQITFDPVTEQVEIIPARDIQIHYNILGFLEYAPCTDCIQITDTRPLDSAPGWEFDVEITHPFENPRLTGFDVRLITMFHAHYVWPISEIRMSNLESNDVEMINGDGYTQLYNSTTTGSGPGGLQGYYPGRLGTDSPPSSRLNPYVTYKSDIPDNDRNAFIAGDTVTRTIQVQWPDSFTGPFYFNYAVDANWAAPDGTGENLDDFPPEANCPEPYRVDVSFINIGPGIHNQGGSVIAKIRVYDHPPYISHLAPRVEAPDFEYEIKEAQFYGLEGGIVPVWHCQINNVKGADEGTYRMLISIEDVENASAPGYLDLTYYQTAEITTRGNVTASGWAQTWGDTGTDRATAVAADKYGSVYVGGQFEGAVDFDPGVDDVSLRTSAGLSDCYLAKYDANGNFVWVKTWGGTNPDYVNAVEIDDYNNLYVVGRFGGTADFDPSSNEWNRTANGATDAYLTKFDQTGNWHWVRSWGGDGEDSAIGVSYDENELYVCGSFQGETDFGLSGQARVSNGMDDAYVIQIDPDSSDTLMTWTWGGEKSDAANGVEYKYDWDYGSGDAIYTVGYFSNNNDGSGIDFDPGPGEDIKTSLGSIDAYAMRIDADTDTYAWTYTWGSEGDDALTGINVDTVNGWVVGGYIGGVIDLDPSDGGQVFSSHHGLLDCFIVTFAKLDDSYVYGYSFGGAGNDYITDVDGDVYGSPFVCGTFTGSVDFDPTIEEDIHTSNGGQDAFVSRYWLDSGYGHVNTWGGPNYDSALGVAGADGFTRYTCGQFQGTVDFNPAGGDEHTSLGDDDSFLMKLLSGGTW